MGFSLNDVAAGLDAVGQLPENSRHGVPIVDDQDSERAYAIWLSPGRRLRGRTVGLIRP